MSEEQIMDNGTSTGYAKAQLSKEDQLIYINSIIAAASIINNPAMFIHMSWKNVDELATVLRVAAKEGFAFSEYLTQQKNNPAPGISLQPAEQQVYA